MQSLGAIDHLASRGPHQSSWIDRGHDICPLSRCQAPGTASLLASG
jgi:hypothetical protein